MVKNYVSYRDIGDTNARFVLTWLVGDNRGGSMGDNRGSGDCVENVYFQQCHSDDGDGIDYIDLIQRSR